MKNNPSHLSRRDFVRETGLTGIALIIGVCLPACRGDSAKIVNAASPDGEERGVDLMSWISVVKSPVPHAVLTVPFG